MKKIKVAFDIGGNQIKIAAAGRGEVKIYVVPTPDNLFRDWAASAPQLLVNYLRELKQKLKLDQGPCALLVPDIQVVCRNITLPAMTQSQLDLNLPFEFKDYISGEITEYIFDYALQEMFYDENGKPCEMSLMGAAMRKDCSAQHIKIFREAGFNLQTLIPREMALVNVMRTAIEGGSVQPDQECCLAILNHRTTEVYIFKGNKIQVMRNIHWGGADIDEAIAEHEGVDIQLAHNYKNTNHNGVLEKEYCQSAYGRIAVEMMKVSNFYRFSNRESTLERIYFAGGGSNITRLCESIAETCGLEVRPVDELLSGKVNTQIDATGLLAVGGLL